MPSHTIHTPSILNACSEMLATASCHNAHAGQSDLGKGRRKRKFWCALIRMKQSLFMSGFCVGISLFMSGFRVGISLFMSGFHFSCRDFVSGFHFSCRDFIFRVGISLFVSGFHSSCRDFTLRVGI